MYTPQPLTPRRWLLLGLLLAALFPFGWLAQAWPALSALIGESLNSAMIHAVGHAAIFFAITLALMAAFPALRRRPLQLLLLALLIGVGQEALQLAYKQRPPVLDDLRDLATDMLGATAALALARLRPQR